MIDKESETPVRLIITCIERGNFITAWPSIRSLLLGLPRKI